MAKELCLVRRCIRIVRNYSFSVKGSLLRAPAGPGERPRGMPCAPLWSPYPEFGRLESPGSSEFLPRTCPEDQGGGQG